MLVMWNARRAVAVLMAAVLGAACGRGESANVAEAQEDTPGLAVAATSTGDVATSSAAAIDSAVQFSDSHLLGFLGMVDNSEIEAAKVARERGSSNRVREFARMMESEHTEFLRRTRALATEIGIEVEPPAGPELEQLHIAAMERLGREPRGEQFDRAYIAGQIEAHERVLAMMQAASNDQRHPRLTTHLRSGIATIEQHRDRARGVMVSLSDDAAAAAER